MLFMRRYSNLMLFFLTYLCHKYARVVELLLKLGRSFESLLPQIKYMIYFRWAAKDVVKHLATLQCTEGCCNVAMEIQFRL